MAEPGRDTPRTLARFPEWVRVTATPGKAKSRQVTKVVLEGLTNDVFVYNNTLVNLERGLAERVFNVERGGGFAPPPRPSVGAFASMHSLIPTLLGGMVSTRITYQEFLAMYSGRKATRYGQAIDSLLVKSVVERDSYLKTFIKAEKVLATDAKPWPAPRVIQPRSYRYNTEVGRYLKPLEHRIYKCINKLWGEPVVMKGYTVEGTARVLRAKWNHFRNPVAIGLDASRFDQHVSVDALRWEHEVYLSCFHPSHREHLGRLLRWQLRNVGTARARDGHIKYHVDGCRMSGDMNTALGNVLLMCMMLYTYLRDKPHVKVVNNGDDCVLIMEESDVSSVVPGISSHFLTLGFTMKIEAPVVVFEQIEFCRMKPVYTAQGYKMVRTAGSAFVRDLTTIISIPNQPAARKWLHAIGTCGQSITHGVPVCHAMYTRLVEAGLESRTAADTWMSDSGFARLRSDHAEPVYVSPEARFSYWLAFGITPDEQEVLESLRYDSDWAPGVSAKAGITLNRLLKLCA